SMFDIGDLYFHAHKAASDVRFPYTTLFRSRSTRAMSPAIPGGGPPSPEPRLPWNSVARSSDAMRDTIIRCPSRNAPLARGARQRDRKSTRLNSSHLGSSYAVFCLKKQKT